MVETILRKERKKRMGIGKDLNGSDGRKSENDKKKKQRYEAEKEIPSF